MPFPMTFVDRVTIIPADWLNFVNNAVAGLPTYPLSVANGGTGGSTSTGAGAVVLALAPTIASPTINSPSISNASIDGHGAGYREVPLNTKSLDYTAGIGDSAGAILHPSTDASGRTFTIPANATVPYPLGTELIFVNDNGAGVLTIAIAGTDTMRLAGAGTTGNRTLAANGIASALKLTSTSWIITGTGLT